MITPARRLAGLAAFLLAVTSGLGYARHRVDRQEVLMAWEKAGVEARHPEIEDRLARERDPARGRLAVARALFADSLDLDWMSELSDSERAAEASKVEARVEWVAAAARATIAIRPAAWEPPMLIGGTRFLSRWRHGDRRLYSEPSWWEAPLSVSGQRAPGTHEPDRLRATGNLTIWFSLADERRDQIRSELADSFLDRPTYRRLLPVWMSVSQGWEETTSPIPPTRDAWAHLRALYAKRKAWPLYCRAHDTWREHAIEEADRLWITAAARLRGGDATGARRDLLSVAATTPPGHASLETFVGAIRSIPIGPIPSRYAPALTRWLQWSLDLQMLDQPALPDDVLLRLTSMVAELEPSLGGLAAAIAGDLRRAEFFAGQEDRLWSEPWAPYGVAMANLLLGRGRPDEAASSLDEVHRSWHRRWAYRNARSALGQTSDPDTAAPPTEWWWRGRTAFTEIEGREPASWTLATTADQGGAVALAIDGTSVACLAIEPGAVITVERPLDAGPHVIEWRHLAGGRAFPETPLLTLHPVPSSR